MLAESQSIDQVVLPSREDASANIIAPYAEGYSEARYVRRCRDYFIAYISSQAGCRQACRFCHLTATGQTSDTDIDIEHQISQLGQILKIYHDRVASGLEPAADYFNINWMARGEPLASRELARNWIGMANEMRLMAAFEGLPVNFNISTIWPKDLALDPRHVDLGSDVTLFYSLYSLDDAWRRRWLPRAADWRQALDHLAEWQVAHAGKIVLHWALIASENDDPGMADKIGREVESRGLTTRFNLVRYNPGPGKNLGTETSEDGLNAYFGALTPYMKVPGSRIVPRVGFDVKASCGMFVEPQALASYF